MAKQLFGVSAHDPLTYVSVAFVLMLVAITACYVPARGGPCGSGSYEVATRWE